MIDLSGPAVTPEERDLLAEGRVAGVCLFGRNVRDRYQVADYVAELRALAGDDLVVAIDQEGGGVVRLFDVPVPPAAMALGAADDPELTEMMVGKAIDLNITLDERICDGFYFIKSLELFDSFIDNPAMLELTPNEAIIEHEKKLQEREIRAREKQATNMEDYWENMMEHPVGDNE